MQLVSIIQLLPAPLAVLLTVLAFLVFQMRHDQKEAKISQVKMGERIGILEQYQAVDERRFENMEKQLEDIKETNKEILKEIKQLHQQIYNTSS